MFLRIVEHMLCAAYWEATVGPLDEKTWGAFCKMSELWTKTDAVLRELDRALELN